MEFLRFAARHIISSIVLTISTAIIIAGYLLEALDIAELGLPIPVWQGIGAALVIGSIVVMHYRFERRVQQAPAGASLSGDQQKTKREALVKTARTLAMLSAGRDDMHFRNSLEGSSVYYDLRPHLNQAFREALSRPRTIYVAKDGSRIPVLAQLFLDEIERLEREWSLS